ncbi:putative ribonuclease H-like domain-containing protein [Tanacetum coccineum]
MQIAWSFIRNGPSIMERNADYAEELAKLQRQEYEAKDAAARYGLFVSSGNSRTTMSKLKLKFEIKVFLLLRILLALILLLRILLALILLFRNLLALFLLMVYLLAVASLLVNLLCNPAGSFTNLLGSVEPAAESNPAVSSPIFSADLTPLKHVEDPDWVDAMQEEMQQFINQQVWKLVPLPDGKHAIGTKWILKNKRDARGIVVRNKARLVAQGHRQEEGIDYDEIRLKERKYVTQPKGFEDPYFPKHVYRVVKALYGLHQAPRAWFMWMTSSLGQPISRVKNLSIDESEFEMSCYWRDDFFLRSISACSRHQVTPLTSHLNAVKKIFKYLKGQPKLGLWYPKDSPFQLEAYSDSDYAGSHGDRKSTTGDVLWIQNQLLDYGFNFMNTKIFIDNQSTICIVKNPVFHQRTKHIEIRHHFIRDANEKNLIQVLKIHTDDNVADLLTKAFDGPRFAYLVVHIGMVDMVLVSADRTMVLLVVILPAGRMVSAGCTMVLLVVIFPAGRLVSAGCTMVLLVVIVPAGFFVPAGSYGLCCWFRVHAGTHTSAGRFISADRVFVPAVYMVSAVG